MKKIVLFALSFILCVILGFMAEVIPQELYYHAVEIGNGRPLPGVTVWIFDVLAIWGNGSLFCVFMLPWALLLLYSLLPHRGCSAVDQSMRLLYGFMCLTVAETLLFVFLILSSLLPFIPLWQGMPPKAPASAYIPHSLLLIVSVVIVFVAVRRVVWRSRR